MSSHKNYLNDIIAGGFSGVCVVLVGHSLDTLKVIFISLF